MKGIFQNFFIWKIFFLFSSVNCLNFNYHGQEELEQLLSHKFPEKVEEPLVARVYSIGKSNEGRDLLVFELTAALQENLNIVPNVQLTANIHGNEPPGREILLHFIDYLILNYGKDEQVTWLLNNTRIHVLPCLNPDGWQIADSKDCVGIKGRHNAKNQDLNRNFPHFMADAPIKEEQVETSAIRKWMDDVSFVLSGDFHAGAIVAIYPFHRITRSKYGYEMQSSVTPDNNLFERLATVYAKNNEIMIEQSQFCDNETFEGGITRGAAWYYFLGGMQDYSYMIHGTMALTFEISCCKFPPENYLETIWNQNKLSLLEFCTEANRGITVLVKDEENDKIIPNANITILGIDKVFRSNSQGRFWKILLPGKYYIRVEAENFETVDTTFEVPNHEGFPKITSFDISMKTI